MDEQRHGITRRHLLKTAFSAGGALLFAPMINLGRYQLFAHSSTEYSARAIRLVRESVVVDMLNPFTLDFPQMGRWSIDPESFTAAHFQRYQESGINVFHIAVGTGGPEAYESTLKFLAGWNAFVAGQDERLMRIDSAADFARVKKSGKAGILLGVQNSEHFRRLDDVDYFYGLGQRVSQLTYNSRNRIGNGSTERRDEGLSDFGVAIVERMNRVGMAVDVSHCGDRTTLDAFEVSKQPVLITHSNCRALVPGHPRCKTDEAIQAMARSGGVMGITGVRMFVKADEPTTIEHLLDHYDHVAKLVGVEHLGVGSDTDLDGYDAMSLEANQRLRAGYKGSYGFREKIDIEGADHPKRTFDLAEGLIRRRYRDADIRLILGRNFQRVLSEIWRQPQPPETPSER
ncbi:MAG: membrane dipeptidase [Gemmatimonadales bacterium]|jgi:membrane dipeptidase|nr:membrane dipeptidase [Gemmatimonadales bacterium]